MLKKGTPASPATARAMSVLPVPGGPTRSTPRGMRAPERVELLRVLQELDDLLELRLGLVDAGHVGERDDGLVAEEHAGPALAEAHRLVVGPLGLPHHEEDEAADQEDRQQRADQEADPLAGLRRLDPRELDRACRRGWRSQPALSTSS